MKILFFSPRYYPHVGGVEKHVARLSQELIKRGHSVVIVTEVEGSIRSKKTFEKKVVDGVEVWYGNFNASLHPLRVGSRFQWRARDHKVAKQSRSEFIQRLFASQPSQSINGIASSFDDSRSRNDKFKKFRIWRTIWKVRHLISDADVVHCHDVFIWYLPFRFLYPFKKVYLTFHGYEQYPLPFKNIVIHKISELFTWGNISIGDFIPKWYKTHANFISYGAADVSKIKSAQRKKNTAVFIGRLDEQTGIKEYVSAYQFVKKQFPQFSLTIFGDGKYRENIEKILPVNGFISDPEIQFPKFEIAFVSRYLSILEALAAKCMVFALYDNPIKKDYLQLAPFAKHIVIGDSPEVLAKRILEFLKDKKSKDKLISDGYQWAIQQTWEKMADLYERLWKL